MVDRYSSQRARASTICIAALLIAAFNIVNLNEAYGSGPPYYSRTVNMDKWQNPLPVLAAIDFAALVVLGFGVRWYKRAVRRR